MFSCRFKLTFHNACCRREEYAHRKVCNALNGETTLASMPQLQAVFSKSYATLDEMIRFSAAIERRLSKCLSEGTIPDENLIDAISVCKIRCIDAATQSVHALRQEVGSYALMWGTGFELDDMFLCTKFAEGDSRILQQKLMRDRLKKLKADGLVESVLSAMNPVSADAAEARAALLLAQKLAPAGRDRNKMAAKMNEHWEEIYALSELIADRHIRTVPGMDFPEPIVERIKVFSPEFDSQWIDNILLRKEELAKLK